MTLESFNSELTALTSRAISEATAKGKLVPNAVTPEQIIEVLSIQATYLKQTLDALKGNRAAREVASTIVRPDGTPA